MPTDEWICKVRRIHTTEQCSATASNEVLTHATTQMNLENMLCERSQTQKDTCCMIPSLYEMPRRGKSTEPEYISDCQGMERGCIGSDCQWELRFFLVWWKRSGITFWNYISDGCTTLWTYWKTLEGWICGIWINNKNFLLPSNMFDIFHVTILNLNSKHAH